MSEDFNKEEVCSLCSNLADPALQLQPGGDRGYFGYFAFFQSDWTACVFQTLKQQAVWENLVRVFMLESMATVGVY